MQRRASGGGGEQMGDGSCVARADACLSARPTRNIDLEVCGFIYRCSHAGYFYIISCLSAFHCAAVWCVPALRVPLVHSQINHFRQKMFRPCQNKGSEKPELLYPAGHRGLRWRVAARQDCYQPIQLFAPKGCQLGCDAASDVLSPVIIPSP